MKSPSKLWIPWALRGRRKEKKNKIMFVKSCVRFTSPYFDMVLFCFEPLNRCPYRSPWAAGTRILLNVSDISLGVGDTYFSDTVEKPAAILSCMSLRRTGGTASSVALRVRRTIYEIGEKGLVSHGTRLGRGPLSCWM